MLALNLTDKNLQIPSWREAPAVRRVAAELHVPADPGAADMRRELQAAEQALSDAEARQAHDLATERDVEAAWARVQAARKGVAAHEERQARAAQRAESSRAIAREIIREAQVETAARIAERGAAVSKRLLAAVRNVIELAELQAEITAAERENFGTLLSQPPDPTGAPVLPSGCYLPEGTKMFVAFDNGGGYEALTFMRDWVRRMEERGF